MLYEMWIINTSVASEQAAARRTEAERKADMNSLIAAHTESGARPVLMCDSGWADEQHPAWGITEFPTLESRIKQHQMMNDYGRRQTSEPSFSLLGTPVDQPHFEHIQPGLVYSLWVVRYEPYSLAAYNALSKEAQAELWDKVESNFNRLGGCWILRCGSYWSNDAYRGFGVEAFPSLEAFQAYKAELEKLDWPMYIPGTSILGTLSPLYVQAKELFG